jgi:hypothetical protein
MLNFERCFSFGTAIDYELSLRFYFIIYSGVYIIARKRYLFPPPPPFSNFIFFPHSRHRVRSKIRLLVP